MVITKYDSWFDYKERLGGDSIYSGEIMLVLAVPSYPSWWKEVFTPAFISRGLMAFNSRLNCVGWTRCGLNHDPVGVL
jgi:hypothetical protein